MDGKTGYIVAALGVATILALGVVAIRRHTAGPMPQQSGIVPPASPAPAVASVATPASCLMPGPAPVPPDGNTATAADMKLGHDTIQAFVNQLEAYQACRIAMADHAAPTVTAQQKQAWIDQGNAAVDDANTLAASFGAQLKTFKARPK